MNLGLPEMIFLFLMALIIFGPRKLPEIGRQIGRALAEFKRASNDFKSQIQSEINQIDLEEQKRQIMAPIIEPPIGVVSTGSLPGSTAAPQDGKAHDA
ncbi:MAG TPA: twin-arginine translocase TatA/TatE family subunit [Terriglobales bacterium]|jgi:Tat protein translocase TatB subunit